jgi:hypothetical protein
MAETRWSGPMVEEVESQGSTVFKDSAGLNGDSGCSQMHGLGVSRRGTEKRSSVT